MFCLPLAAYACYAADQLDLQKEDVHAIQLVLKERDASLDWVEVVAKKGVVGTTDSIMVVDAAPTELWAGTSKRTPVLQKTQIWVFVVSGTGNQVRLILDFYPLRDLVGNPTLEEPAEHSAYLHFHKSYGMYDGSVKYIYDLSSKTPVQKIRYGILALTSVAREKTKENTKLRYLASFRPIAGVPVGWKERDAIITITPAAGDLLPEYEIVDAPAQENTYRDPTPLRVAGGESVIVANQTPPGRGDEHLAIFVVDKSGTKQMFSPPLPSMDFYRKTLPVKQPPLEMESDIGPFVLSGRKIWFASTFYDGEGVSGIGAIGTFDIPTRKYQMRYLPEIVEWSGSSILLDGNDLWIGLKRRPEGADYGGGLLRYNTKTGAARKYSIPDVIYTIDRVGNALYCGSSHGLYMVRDDQLTQLRFEPDSKGKLIMLAREVR